jgi:hypothetical protein
MFEIRALGRTSAGAARTPPEDRSTPPIKALDFTRIHPTGGAPFLRVLCARVGTTRSVQWDFLPTLQEPTVATQCDEAPRVNYPMNFTSTLRRELAIRAQNHAAVEALPHSLSYGEAPIVCFAPYAEDSLHGNFLPQSYKAILANPEWRKRLTKVHTQGRRSLPVTDRGRWMELDSCVSSDALLMNIFCHPRVPKDRNVLALLGVESDASLRFGYKARVPLLNGKFDRTEVDLRLGNLLIEAKLTEGDFQSASKSVLKTYRDFSDVFDRRQLPQTEDRYFSYQLLRNVLAAHALECSFCVLVDSRRPDLIDAWYAVMKCVRQSTLRTKLRISTWQELAQVMPPKIQRFLAAKYGIEAPDRCKGGSGSLRR